MQTLIATLQTERHRYAYDLVRHNECTLHKLNIDLWSTSLFGGAAENHQLCCISSLTDRGQNISDSLILSEGSMFSSYLLWTIPNSKWLAICWWLCRPAALMGVTKVDTDAQRAPMINQLFTMPLFEGSRGSEGRLLFVYAGKCGWSKV